MEVSIRLARKDDLAGLAAIEDAADSLFGASGEAWGSAPSGDERADDGGFLLVADAADTGVVGFAHVLTVDVDGVKDDTEPSDGTVAGDGRAGQAHLEQVSVHPRAGRQGIGRLLVTAAMVEAAARGYGRMTLRTFAEVPWNAPFYASLGFHVEDPVTAFDHHLVEIEDRLGLSASGARVQMGVPLPEHPGIRR